MGERYAQMAIVTEREAREVNPLYTIPTPGAVETARSIWTALV